jgi:hypothetical protein
MADKTVSLPLPAAIDAAYLLLIGQLCLSLSRLAFGIVYVAENDLHLSPSATSLTIWSLCIAVVIMLFVNIVSCWKSTRSTFDEIGYYPNRLLTSDVFIIVSFFFLNTIAAAPLGFMENITLEADGIAKYLKDIERLWSPVLPLLFGSSALLVLSYRAWNKAYLAEKQTICDAHTGDQKTDAEAEIANLKPMLERFNSLYGFASILFLVFAVSQIAFDQFVMTVSFLVVWLIFWIYVNFNWLLSPPTERPTP